jgi:hypothetical protein
MRYPAVIDGRRIYCAEDFREHGIAFKAVGLGVLCLNGLRFF